MKTVKPFNKHPPFEYALPSNKPPYQNSKLTISPQGLNGGFTLHFYHDNGVLNPYRYEFLKMKMF